MKKILLLGGSSQQVIAIQKAKSLGYYTVLCDFLSDNPGQNYCDKFYLVSTTDLKGVLKIAIDEKVDGIVAYSSDPAAPTAAFVADKLGLAGIPYGVAECFCNKNLFRSFLKEYSFNVPSSLSFDYNGNSLPNLSSLKPPLIIKPTDSSGSKGVTVIEDLKDLPEACDCAIKHSRSKRLIIEEFIQRDHPEVIEAEIFVIDSKVVVWGLISSIRDELTNPLIPAAYSYPINLSESRINIVKNEIKRLVNCSGVTNGAFNLEMIITKEDKLYFLDVGPRNGGNMLPEFIGMIGGVDLTSATILNSMGELNAKSEFSMNGHDGGVWGLYVIHSLHDGILKNVHFDTLAKSCLIKVEYFKPFGSFVKRFNDSRDAIGLAFFKFPNVAYRDIVLNDFKGEHIVLEIG